MSIRVQHLLPTTTMTRRAPRKLKRYARLAGDYRRVPDGAPPFVMGDAFSLSAQLAAAIEREATPEAVRYAVSYRATCDGLGVPRFSAVTEALGLHTSPAAVVSPIRRKVWDVVDAPNAIPADRGKAARNRRRLDAGIKRLLWLRRHAVELQDPWWGALEGDIWGRRAIEGDGAADVANAVDAYEALADQHLLVLSKIDAALCALAALPSSRTVDISELRSRWGFPPLEDDDDDWF